MAKPKEPTPPAPKRPSVDSVGKPLTASGDESTWEKR